MLIIGKEKYLVYLNCLLYMLVAVMLISGALKVVNDEYWKNVNTTTSFLYALLLIGATLFMSVIAFGLLRFKDWARRMAVPWNLVVAYLLIGMKLIYYLILEKSFNYSMYFDFNTIFQTVIGVSLMLLAMSYLKKSIKKIFS